MLARGLETLKYLYNPLIHMKTNVKNCLRKVLRHLNPHVTI